MSSVRLKVFFPFFFGVAGTGFRFSGLVPKWDQRCLR
jgi:hypothetical protein